MDPAPSFMLYDVYADAEAEAEERRGSLISRLRGLLGGGEVGRRREVKE